MFPKSPKDLLVESIKKSVWYSLADEEVKEGIDSYLKSSEVVNSFTISDSPLTFYESITLSLFNSKAFMFRSAEEQGKIIEYQLREKSKRYAERIEKRIVEEMISGGLEGKFNDF